MKTHVVYLRGGIGDQYAFFAMLPTFLQHNRISIDNLEIYVDSVYFYAPKQFEREKTALLSIYKQYGITNIIEIPGNIGSAHDLCFLPKERQYGFNLETIGFLHGRKQETKNYINNILKNRILIDVPFVEHVLIYTDRYFKMNLTRLPVRLPVSSFQCTYLNWLINLSRTIVVHARYKGKQENAQLYNNLIENMFKHNMTPILIGFNNGIKSAGIDLRDKLSFEECWYLVENAKNTLLSGSNFAFHRLACEPKCGASIYLWPESLGSYKLNPNEYINNNHNFAFNSDVNSQHNIVTTLINYVE